MKTACIAMIIAFVGVLATEPSEPTTTEPSETATTEPPQPASPTMPTLSPRQICTTQVWKYLHALPQIGDPRNPYRYVVCLYGALQNPWMCAQGMSDDAAYQAFAVTTSRPDLYAYSAIFDILRLSWMTPVTECPRSFI